MRRLMSLAAFAVVLAVPVWAQRGGGHTGGGGPASFSGGHMGGFAGRTGSLGGAHMSGGYSGSHGGVGYSHSYGPRPYSGYSHNPYLHGGYNGHHVYTHFYTYGIRNNCYGYVCRGGGYRYPWWGAAYYPWWWDEQDRQFDDDYYRQYDIANEMNRQSLEQQRMLRQEEADGDQDAYASRPSGRDYSSPAPTAGAQGSPTVPPTTLIFRDHRQKEVSNYAIVGNTLWNFSAQRTEKIALADLDVPATEKANEDRGVTFHIPGVDEGQ